jgi:hypothetical protein
MLDQGEEESRVRNRGVVRIDERNGEWGTAQGGGVMRRAFLRWAVRCVAQETLWLAQASNALNFGLPLFGMYENTSRSIYYY